MNSLRRSLLLGLLAAVATGMLFPPLASAHGLVGRVDLPVPIWLFGWAAAVVLLLSFAALALLWRSPVFERLAAGHRFLRIPRAADVVCGLIGVALFVVIVYCGFAGVQVGTANLAPTFIYVHFWIGLAVLSVLFGDVFAALNPWRAVGNACSWVATRLSKGSLPPPLKYPTWLGQWPAALGLLAFAWLELAYGNRDDPSTLAALALVYSGIQFIGMALFGVRQWSERGDAFGVYFNLFSRLAPFTRRDGVLYLRMPLSGAPDLPVMAGTVAVICVAIGSTTFDGLAGGELWNEVLPHIQGFSVDLGASLGTGLELTQTVGLLAVVLIVAAFYRLGIRGMSTVGSGHSTSELAGKLAHTLIPIAFAYAFAHYFSLLVYQGQAIIFLASDPLGNGSDIFGTASQAIDYAVISATGIWYVQVAVLVLGHVAALMLAHDRALKLYTDLREAMRSQYWLLAIMVGFTCLGLWLLSEINQ